MASGELDDLDQEVKDRLGMGDHPTAWKTLSKSDQPETPSPEHSESEYESGFISYLEDDSDIFE